MGAFIRKKQQSVIPKTLKKERTIQWFIFIKPLVVLLCCLFVFIVYNNWRDWLAKLDTQPIQAYALTHKTQFTTNADIREALAKAPELKGYFEQDIQQVAEKLKQMSWVKDVVVRKIYPDKLRITLLEHTPFAVWNNVNLVSDQGVVFNLSSEKFDKTGLPILFGPDSESKKVLTAWDKIKKDIEARNLSLKSVGVDNRGSWKIVLTNNIELRLGRGDWLPKIDRFVTIFPEIEVPEGKRIGYVDLRYEYGAAVGFVPIQ